MGLKYRIRSKMVSMLREALADSTASIKQDSSLPESLDKAYMEDLYRRIDKQIERWTWERFKRTDKLFDEMDYELIYDLDKGIDRLDKMVSVSIDKQSKNIKETIIKATDEKIVKAIDEKTKFWTNKRFEQTDKQIERWTWERYKRSEDKLLYVYKLQNQISELLFQQNKVPYLEGEKIRIVFLFQVASFWPSWESLYKACLEDERIDVCFLYLDETVREKVQMVTAENFLQEKKIPYMNFVDFDLDAYRPHVIVMQTPYDAGHRIKAHWSSAWKAKGYRVVYVPYGIEISDTETSHGMHFEQHVIENAWRVYTFSELMLKDYRRYCVNAGAVRVLGLPKFDALYHKEDFQLNKDLTERINGRKICLWKVHFPKIFEENGKDIFVTPDVNEYIKFAEYAVKRSDIFFIFMPHPRFQEPVKNKKLQELAIKLVNTLEGVENVYIDREDDYRYSLVNADFIMIDRSAVMVEAAAVDVPVLYMINQQFMEPVTKAIEPLMNSYEQGSTCEDMIHFVNTCMDGQDRNQEERNREFHNCIPYFDGKAGERIKEDIRESVVNER